LICPDGYRGPSFRLDALPRRLRRLSVTASFMQLPLRYIDDGHDDGAAAPIGAAADDDEAPLDAIIFLTSNEAS
jgi:hypothetical protein